MLDLVIPVAAAAQVIAERTPFSYDWITYLWVLVWGAAGGTVSFIRKVRAGEARPFNFAEFIGEIVTSAFVALLTFWLCEWAQVDRLLSAVFIGVTAHMGSRALFVGEKIIEQWVTKRTGVIMRVDDETKNTD